jgi:hypothetical protein
VSIVVVISDVSNTAGSEDVAVTVVVFATPASCPNGIVSTTAIGALAPGLSVMLAGTGCALHPARVVLAARLIVSVKLPLLVSS